MHACEQAKCQLAYVVSAPVLEGATPYGCPSVVAPLAACSSMSTCAFTPRLLRHAGDYDSAEEMYLRALQIDPKHIVTLCNFGVPSPHT